MSPRDQLIADMERAIRYGMIEHPHTGRPCNGAYIDKKRAEMAIDDFLEAIHLETKESDE